jgi:hypothetical protein
MYWGWSLISATWLWGVANEARNGEKNPVSSKNMASTLAKPHTSSKMRGIERCNVSRRGAVSKIHEHAESLLLALSGVGAWYC